MLPELALREEYRNIDYFKRNNQTCKIVFVGRLIGKKGIAFLVDALSYMPNDLSWELDIYGDGVDRESIEKKIENSVVANHINLLGNRPLNQISEAYKTADIFVLPSLRETSGNVLLEAMAYAVPIVAFDTSFSSMLKEHDCGIFIDTNQNIEAIKRDFCCALTRLIKDAGLREQLGLNGKDFANANLTWEQKFKHIYMRDETK